MSKIDKSQSQQIKTLIEAIDKNKATNGNMVVITYESIVEVADQLGLSFNQVTGELIKMYGPLKIV